MSRDFLVTFTDPLAAQRAEMRLKQAFADDGLPLFEVDNRGSDLFVTLTYPREIRPEFAFKIGDHRYERLHDDVVFVALKNGQHSGTGYFLDTGVSRGEATAEFPLAEIPERILSALGIGQRTATAIQ